jgi:hypothetical protein
MMNTTVDIGDVIGLHKAGRMALETVLGLEETKAFIKLSFGGYGDFTKERHERPERSNEEIFADIMRLQEERKALNQKPKEITDGSMPIVELWSTGNKALNDALGPELSQAFKDQFLEIIRCFKKDNYTQANRMVVEVSEAILKIDSMLNK